MSPSPCLYTFTLKLCLLNNSNSMSFPLKKSKNTCLKSKLFIYKERVDIFLNHTSGKNMTEKNNTAALWLKNGKSHCHHVCKEQES